ncbi:hypothetical protein ACFX2C_014793 [Malus domestica]
MYHWQYGTQKKYLYDLHNEVSMKWMLMLGPMIAFVCGKTVPVPYVPQKERYLVGRIGPKSYGMYRCMAVVKTYGKFGTVLVMAQTSGLGESSCSSSAAIVSSAKCPALQNLQATYEQEALKLKYWRQGWYGLLDAKCKDSLLKEQLQELVEAKHAG